MDKAIYVVTSGEYSDYGIDSVFLNKEKAKAYCNVRNGDYRDDYRVETYFLSDDSITIANDNIICDDKQYSTKTYLRYSYISGKYPADEPSVELVTFTLTNDEEIQTVGESFKCPQEFINAYIFSGMRRYDGELTDEVIKKFKKHCYDQMAYCKGLQIEGMSPDKITEVLRKD